MLCYVPLRKPVNLFLQSFKFSYKVGAAENKTWKSNNFSLSDVSTVLHVFHIVRSAYGIALSVDAVWKFVTFIVLPVAVSSVDELCN